MKINTKYGVIRNDKHYGFSGYVSMGKKYFSVNEQDVIMDYVNRGYIIKENKYIIQGGSHIDYLYRYKDEYGDVHEEFVENIEHPTMIMITRLEKAD